jgi:diguanylate cyclase (GGDEF)-like protein/PAS domain S-box-containing protein
MLSMRPVRLLPRYLLIGVALATLAAGLTAAILYVVYRDALSRVVDAAVDTNRAVLAAQVDSRSPAVIEALAAALAPAVAAGDPARTRQLLVDAMAESGADLILVRGSDGSLLQHAGDLGMEAGVGGGGPRRGGERLTVTTPLIFNGAAVGTLIQVFDAGGLLATNAELGRQLASIRAQARRTVVMQLIGFGAVALLLIAALAGVLAWRQARTIRSLVAGAERLARGDFGAQLPTDRGDELGQLARAFHEMRDRLRDTTVSRDYLDRMIGNMSDAIILASADERIVRVNTATTALLEYREDELIGRPVKELLPAGERAAFQLTAGPRRDLESVMLTRSGRAVPVSLSSSALPDPGGEGAGFIVSARDISERKAAEKRIRYLARTDSLTKVPNRLQFQHLLQRAIARGRRSGKRLALLYLDVDRFKDINDTFGHTAGDSSLETLTKRVLKLLPEGGFIGRLAGDEFGIALEIAEPAAGERAWLQSMGRRILKEIADVLIVQGHELYITASMGIARFPDDADNVPDLIRNADAALYHAKGSGGNRLEFYDPEMNAAAVERLMIKSKLRRSYELDELLVNYQPKVRLDNGQVAGAEALVRWELSEHGLVLPSEFIPLAEETGLILEIGEWVLNRVCADMANWRRQGGEAGRVSVNLSLKQLSQPNFARRINRIFRRHDITPDSLELEITETTLMQNPEYNVRVLRELRRMGLHLAIDDFGTGYSSLSALQQFPIETLKIDRSFVANAVTNSDDATIVATVIEMAHNLNMQVVAEGVESGAQLDFLRRLGCDYVQGLLFGSPMSSEDYLGLIETDRGGDPAYRGLFAGAGR